MLYSVVHICPSTYCHVQDGSLCDSNIYCTMYVQLGLTLAYDIIVDNNVFV